MDNKYDVIIVGAGNSGLSAGVTTAQAGLKTLLIDQYISVGGVAGSVVRGRFEFEKSLHELSGCPMDPNLFGAVIDTFHKQHIDPPLWVAHETYRLIVDNDEEHIDLVVPYGSLQAIIDAIEAYSPGSKRYTEPFFAYVEEAYRGLMISDMQENIKQNPHFLRLSCMTLVEVEDALDMPKTIRTILDGYWGYGGITSDEVSFLYFSNMIYIYFVFGGAVFKHRSSELNMLVLRRYLDCGGKLLCNTNVNKLLMQDGACVGVETERGTFYAKKVIAAVNRHIVYSRLMDFDQIPERAVRQANARDIGVRPFVVNLGLNKSCEELGLKEYSYFIYPSGDPHKCKRSLVELEGPKSIAAVCLNAAIPGTSPEGTCTLNITSMFKPGPLLDGFDNANREAYTAQIADMLIAEVERATGADLRGHIEEMFVASPIDVIGNTQAYDGMMYGYELHTLDSMLIRWHCLEEDNCIKNLLFAGATAQNGHGYGASIRVGYIMGTRAIKEIEEESK